MDSTLATSCGGQIFSLPVCWQFEKIYIQSAFALPDEAKTEQELKPFSLTNDYFPKIIVRKDIRKRWYNDDGILNIGLIDFLLDDNLF